MPGAAWKAALAVALTWLDAAVAVSLPQVRAALQQRYASRDDVVASMDTDLSGIITNDEFRRFATRAPLALTEPETEELLQLLCQQQQRLTERQLDALSFDVQIPGLRLLMRAEYQSTAELMMFLDTNGDDQIDPTEWTAGLLLKQISSSNALELFQSLDPGGLGFLSEPMLRLLVGHLSLCDYRELLRSEGNFSAGLAAADVNADFKVLPEELVAQALPYCISESEALALHAQLDVLTQGFVDLFALSDSRIPQMLQRDTLVSYRACLKSYFPNELAAVQDLAVLAAGFPANLRALQRQGAVVAWQAPAAMERLFERLDPLATSALPRRRFESALAGTVTLSGLRLLLAEVAPGGQGDLLQRADIDQGATLSQAEFTVLGQLLGLETGNVQLLFGLLNYTGDELDSVPLQTLLGEVTLVHFRLLVLNEFGSEDPFAVADKDASETLDVLEFRDFAGTVAVNASNAQGLFEALDVSGSALRPAQLMLFASSVLDLALLRHLIRAELSEVEASNFLSLIDSSGNGLVELQEFEAWALKRLALPPASLSKAFADLDLCQQQQLHAEQLNLLIERPTVVVLRALLASRYPQQEYAILTADSDDDGLISLQEFSLFMQDLFIGSADASSLLQRLDTNQDGDLQREELLVASAPELKLFDFRRLVAWSFNAEESFQLADEDKNQLVSQQELQLLGCRWLALKGNVTSFSVFRVVDLAFTGEVSLDDLSLALGEVEANGFRALVQAVFSAGVEAFLTTDLNGDRLLQRSEFFHLASALAIGQSNAEVLFQSLATRRPDAIHQDVFLLAVNGLGQFRALLRESYADQRSALLDFDTMQPWNEVTYEEFFAWCGRLQLPETLIPQLFVELDTRKEEKLGPWHFQMLLAGEITARGFGQLLVSAFRQLSSAFQKADLEGDSDGLVSLSELTRLAQPLGVRSPNVAQVFAELDVEQVGYLSLGQFQVMASPQTAFRLSNAQAELEPIHIHEMHLYSDEACIQEIPCEFPMSSGHYQAPAGNGTNASEFPAGWAFDGRSTTRWVSQCGPCREEMAWIGCQNDRILEIRCMKLYQTAPVTTVDPVDVVPLSSVAAALRMQTWNGKSWQTVAEIAKPPLWEIDNFGEAFVFKPAQPISSTSRLNFESSAEDVDDFQERFGVSLPILVLICLAVGICGLLCLCVLCPILSRPSCLNALRVNAPERMDAKRNKRLDKIIQMKQEVRAMEAAVSTGATTTDEWGMTHKVQHQEQKVRERQLDKMRKAQAKMEYSALAKGGGEMPTEERIEKRKAEMERYRRMKEAYESKTIAVDGVALQAPEAVLLELGFDQEMFEAFGLPGFSSTERPDALPDEEEMQESEDSDDEEESEEEESEEEDEPQTTATPSKFDDGRVTVLPQLDEAPALFKEGARLRRNAMAGMEEGKPMDAEELKRAQRKAALLKGSELKEEDDVEKWMSQRKDTKSAKVLEIETMDLDQEAIQREKKKEFRLFNAEKRRLRALAGDAKDAEDEASGSEDDVEAQLTKAAAPREKVTMNIFKEAADEDIKPKKELSRKSKSSLGRSKTAELSRGRSADLGRHRSKFGEDLAKGKSKDLRRGPSDVHATALAAAEAAAAAAAQADAVAEAALATVEVTLPPEPYEGEEVYRGMPVMPRGLGTPRRNMLAGEVYRSSLDAPLSEMGDGLQWGRFSKAKPHFRTAEDRARDAQAQRPAVEAQVKPEAREDSSPVAKRGLVRRLLAHLPRLRRPKKMVRLRLPRLPKLFRRKAVPNGAAGSAPGSP